jgi:hypothetical protein
VRRATSRIRSSVGGSPSPALDGDPVDEDAGEDDDGDDRGGDDGGFPGAVGSVTFPMDSEEIRGGSRRPFGRQASSPVEARAFRRVESAPTDAPDVLGA